MTARYCYDINFIFMNNLLQHTKNATFMQFKKHQAQHKSEIWLKSVEQ